MRVSIYMVIILLLAFPVDNWAITLNNGITRNDAGWQEATTFLYQKGYYPLAVYVNDTQSEIIAMRTGISIYDMATKAKKFGKNLTRWPYQYYAEEIKNRYLTEGVDPESIGLPLYTSGFNSVGCLSNTPLRYGQLVSGGENYIVLLLNDQFILFSPQYKRTVFAEYINNGDWYSAEKTSSIVTLWGRGKQQYQYMSMFLAGVSLPTEEPGYRFYAKLYVDDFDKDGNPDIVVWRKMYETNRIENPTLGFTLLRNEWQHYEQDLNAQEKSEQGITGEYLPQTTDEATIKTWLADNALTWKKGYPDVSECAADNGGPIPEMSDPLLNDPEVLQ